ncbi:TlpA disulfide reductase family protein [Undibacterium cyanobacteriorum]|uniref:TlpA disulfide reductase family protein n=1 Tax=Undibacterium cyanobacteriorum TaxID=3073561 RepID=A0ABY9RG09_9BURK|nr:TlpA disulfide reductase family protein [Undibacterium sp. 20NA77.5]WMW80166.1 TlpA disulfide reductase family protein [Undibacterium sp. 20NA77.5]
MNSKKILVPALLLLLALIAAATWMWSGSQRVAAPSVEYTNLKGEKLGTQSLRGKVYLVNFWATSCSTCIAEMPEMIRTYEKYRAKGFDFVAVAMSYDPPNYVLNFTETRALPFHVALDVEGKLANAFGDIKLTPTTFLIDKQGRIVKRYIGKPSFEELEQLIEKEIAAS